MKDQTLTEDSIDNEWLKQSNQKFRLGIGQLMSRDNDSLLSEKVTSIITKELIIMLGREYVLELNKNRKGRKANLVLVGAIGKLGHELIISTKIIDVENSQVLFAGNAELINENDIPVKSKYISEKIFKYLNQKYKE